MSASQLRAIGDLVEPVSTWMPERDDPAGVFTYVDLSAVDQDAKVVTGARELACLDAPSRARQLVRAGDVLVSTVRPNLNGVALVSPELDGATASTGFCVLRPRSGQLDGRYLYQWTKSPRFVSDMVRKATGASYPAVSDRIVCQSKLPLPSFPEQLRIAEILGRADALRVKRRAALAQLDTLTHSIFLDMFGDPATNPKGWPRNALGSVSVFYAGSTLPKGRQFTGQRSGYFLLKVSDMNLAGNEVYFATSQQWSDVPGAASSTCPESSVVIPKRGAAIATNKKRITTRASVLDPNLMAIFPRQEHLTLAFLYAWLLRLDLNSITSGSSVPQLNKRDLDPLSIPVPPLTLQLMFADRIAQVQRVVSMHRKAASRLDMLFVGLQQHAFRGAL